jgi:hypothetical protein
LCAPSRKAQSVKDKLHAHVAVIHLCFVSALYSLVSAADHIVLSLVPGIIERGHVY